MRQPMKIPGYVAALMRVAYHAGLTIFEIRRFFGYSSNAVNQAINFEARDRFRAYNRSPHVKARKANRFLVRYHSDRKYRRMVLAKNRRKYWDNWEYRRKAMERSRRQYYRNKKRVRL
jgi:hypothetical protein